MELIYAPGYRDILYPGYVNRITAFTGVCVYTRVIRGGVKLSYTDRLGTSRLLVVMGLHTYMQNVTVNVHQRTTWVKIGILYLWITVSRIKILQLLHGS